MAPTPAMLEMSPPAANTLSPPVRMMQRTCGSAASWLKCSANRACSSRLRALVTVGRLRVSRATPGAGRSSRTQGESDMVGLCLLGMDWLRLLDRHWCASSSVQTKWPGRRCQESEAMTSNEGWCMQSPSQLDYSGKVVLVTGGTKGIGAGIASAYLAAGAEVFVCGRQQPEQLPEANGRQAQ